MKYDQLDDDTIRLFAEILFILNNMFSYSEIEARELINKYLSKYYSESEEDLLYHEGSYRAAGIIHFTAGLLKDRKGLRDYLSQGMPGNKREAADLLVDFNRNETLPKILGGNAE